MAIDGLLLECRRVLVAEDQFIVAIELAETLQDAGYAVLGSVASNAEGLELLRRMRPDAALVDATLADGQAVPLVEALLATGVPVGLSTGYSTGEVEPLLHGLPRLGKPYGQAEVVGFVRRLLGAEKDAA